MEALTFDQYQKFIKEEIRVKIINEENLFYDFVCPVYCIGFDWIGCDVDEDGGTASFDFDEVELSEEPIKYTYIDYIE